MAGLKIMLLCYWPLDDVLTQAAVLPHIKILQRVYAVSEVILVTIEREKTVANNTALLAGFSQIKHYALQSKNYRGNLLNKINDFLTFPRQLNKIIETENIGALLASGTLAGALAYKVWQKYKIPFYVIFEPHAAYMVESKVWHVFDPRYIFQKKWEQEQAKAASGLIVVAEEYRQVILRSYPALNSNTVFFGRNPVEVDKFKFSEADRKKVRRELLLPDSAAVGIYVGKYGGLYYDDEAFRIYKKCFGLIPDFRLLILSPQSQNEISQQLYKYNIDPEKVYVTTVPHREVPAYLSAADFAFATIKSYPSARYCSPIKIGEYWVNGLPVLLTEGVGDDSDIIKREGGGATFNLSKENSLETALQEIKSILADPNHRTEIPELAAKYRSPEKIREAYDYFFGKLKIKQL